MNEWLLVCCGLRCAHTGQWTISSPPQAKSLNIWWIPHIIITWSPARSSLLTLHTHTHHSSHLCFVHNKCKSLWNHQFRGNNFVQIKHMQCHPPQILRYTVHTSLLLCSPPPSTLWGIIWHAHVSHYCQKARKQICRNTGVMYCLLHGFVNIA